MTGCNNLVFGMVGCGSDGGMELQRTRWGERLGSKYDGWSGSTRLPRLGTCERGSQAEWVSGKALRPLAELGSGCSLTAQSTRKKIRDLAHDLPWQLNVYEGNDTQS